MNEYEYEKQTSYPDVRVMKMCIHTFSYNWKQDCGAEWHQYSSNIHMSHNFWYHFHGSMNNACLFMRLSDHKEWTTVANASKLPQRLKWRQCVFFSSAAAGRLIQQGWFWKQVAAGTKSSELSSECPSSPVLRLHVFLQAALTGRDAEARMADCLGCTGSDLPRDYSGTGNVCSSLRLFLTEISLSDTQTQYEISILLNTTWSPLK